MSGAWPVGAADWPHERPFDRLQALPRTLWLPGLVCSAGAPAARLDHARAWLDALAQGRLPDAALDFGEPQGSVALRTVVGELGLPGLCAGVPDLGEQLLRALLWHLDRIADLQPRLSRDEAVRQLAAEFRAAWQLETQGLEQVLALLQDLGDLAHLRWDALRGALAERPWAAARRAAEWLAQLPELAALIERLGRTERLPDAPARQPAPAPQAEPAPLPQRLVETCLPEAPGEVTGVRLTHRPEQMLASEALMLRHPVLRRLWRARQAEGRLLGWDSQAVLRDWRPDPTGVAVAAPPPRPAEPQGRGPILLCLDTSGSMRGAPENIAKAVVIAALRAAHASRRGVRLIAFGGPGELLEQTLDHGPDGLQALLALMGRSFDGGTDVQTPIERAIDAVHEAGWRSADLLIVSDGEFGCVPATLARLDEARDRLGLRVQGVLVGDRETIGLLEVCDDIHWVRDWRRYADAAEGGDGRGYSPVHSRSLTALYFPNALSGRAARHLQRPAGPPGAPRRG